MAAGIKKQGRVAGGFYRRPDSGADLDTTIHGLCTTGRAAGLLWALRLLDADHDCRFFRLLAAIGDGACGHGFIDDRSGAGTFGDGGKRGLCRLCSVACLNGWTVSTAYGHVPARRFAELSVSSRDTGFRQRGRHHHRHFPTRQDLRRERGQGRIPL